jgi:macrodomain Ter protein organizer (MatP/YcbG family)
MDNKLTLKLDKTVIDRAKKYAAKNNTSLSRMIESYLDQVTSNKKTSEEISPLVKSLSGVINLPENYNEKKEYKKHLSSKYSK